jgi:dolichol kinase
MLVMLAVFACLAGLFIILVLTEYLGNRKILKGEYLRKFFHITAVSFIAFWPWLVSWRDIQVMSLGIIFFMLAGRYFGLLNYHGRIHRVTYGDILLALAIFISSIITHNKIIFAVAILQVALADGMAAVWGISFGKRWQYKVFGYTKTVMGTMAFWLVSVSILTAGVLASHNLFTYRDYYYLLLLLPPVLTILENFAVLGADNIVIPLVTIAALNLFQA